MRLQVYIIRPAPSNPATNTAAMLPTRPVIGGTSPAARDAALLLLEADAVVVPFVWDWSWLMSGVKLESEPKAADTLLAFLQTEVE